MNPNVPIILKPFNLRIIAEQGWFRPPFQLLFNDFGKAFGNVNVYLECSAHDGYSGKTNNYYQSGI